MARRSVTAQRRAMLDEARDARASVDARVRACAATLERCARGDDESDARWRARCRDICEKMTRACAPTTRDDGECRARMLECAFAACAATGGRCERGRAAVEALAAAARGDGERASDALDALSRTTIGAWDEASDAMVRRSVADAAFGAMETAIGAGGRTWARATSALCRTAARLDARDTEDGKRYLDESLRLLETRESECGSGDADARARAAMCARLSGARVLGSMGSAAKESARGAFDETGALRGELFARAVPALLEHSYKDKAGSVRRACAEALGRMGLLKTTDVRQLGRALGDKRDDVRTAATRSVGAQGGVAKFLVPKLVENARRDDPELRQTTCEALESVWKGRQGDPAQDGSEDVLLFQTAECMGELTNDADAGVRAAATRCLGHLRGAAAAKVSLINKRVDDSDEGVRDAAAETLIKLGFINPSTGTLRNKGNYRTSKFSANKNLFAVLTGKQDSLATTSRVNVPAGAIVRVWWPLDECYYEAKVKGYDKSTRKYRLLYLDDNVEEEVNFRKEKVDLKHKPTKNARATWIPCGAVQRKPKSKEKDQPKHKIARKRSSATSAWVDYDAEEQKRIGREALVGRRMKVWWPDDKAWYAGEIRRFSADTGKYTVFYFEDGEEEDLDFDKEERAPKIYEPVQDESATPTIHGLEPRRLPVRSGEKDALYEPGCFRGSECCSFVNEEGEKTTMLCSDFDKMYGGGSRWRRSIVVTSETGAEPIDTFFRVNGERWGNAVLGYEFDMDVAVDMRDFPVDRQPVEPSWQRVKIISYNPTSGEHQCVDIKDDGEPDPSRAVWLPLCMQRTRARAAADDDDGEDSISDIISS